MDKNKLAMWKERLAKNKEAYSSELSRMVKREQLYKGEREVSPVAKGDKRRQASHVYNLISEIVESQVDTAIPQPKVTAMRKEDEHLAKLIEDMLKGELVRQKFCEINDLMERTVPIQGGGYFFLQWDMSERSHDCIGEIVTSYIHPKQIVPQNGVYTDISDMDYFIISIPQTADGIKRKYNIKLDTVHEEEPDIKGGEYESECDDMVTQYIAYYKNGEGGIGAYSWVCDTEIYDYFDCQSRRIRSCAVCGAAEPYFDGNEHNDECTYCGSKHFIEKETDYEYICSDIFRSDGSIIPAYSEREDITSEKDEFGMPVFEKKIEQTAIPYYKPDVYPLILQKNVSVFGRLLGDSDVDKIADQQNTMNRIEGKIIDKLVKAGSYITLPEDASIRFDSEDMKVIRPGSAAAKAMIDVYSLEGDISQDLSYLKQLYEEAKQIIGITDSLLGKKDTTAISGKAKLIAAQQSQGRFESKRVLKNAAYAKLYELMFKFRLAYADEPRPVLSRDVNGNTQYDSFNRYDFLMQDEAGDWYWNDNFIFSTESSPAISTRETMWEETRENLRNGAFGDPSDLQTLLLFWSKMELLHYPGAEETKRYLESTLSLQTPQSQAK